MLLASCADEFDRSYEVGRPDNVAEYGYLSDYKPLKEYVDRSKYPNFKLGVGTTVSDYLKKELVYGLTNSNFDETVAGNAMKMASCVNDNGDMDFSTVSEYVTAATEAGLSVYGHTLAWHAQQPVKWLNALIADRPVEVDPDGMVDTEDAYFNYGDYTSYPFYDMDPDGHVIEDGCLVVIPKDPTGANWERQYFVADWISLKVGEEYTITVRMKGSSEGHADVVLGTWGASNNGFIDFTDEWQELSTTIRAASDASGDAHVLLQTGLYTGELRVEWVRVTHKEASGPATYFASLIDNGDMEGTDAKNFAKKENSGDTVYEITDGVGVDGSGGVRIASKGGQADAWESQFWIVSNEVLYEGDKVHVAFDYRADGGCVGTTVDTQAHFNPGEYQHWSMAGSPTFTADWQTFDKIVVIDASMAGANGMKSIAFNMSPNAEDGAYYIDNVVFEIEKAGDGIPLTPEEKKDTLTWAMDKWIAGMMAACDGNVKAWDVVNEAISGGNADGEGVYALQHGAEGNTTDFFWQDYLGDIDYVRTAVRSARQYGPEDLKLFVNDYNLESDWDSNGKLKSLIKWIERWEADGVTKIDGIGTQMHISCYADPNTQASKKAAIENMFKLMAATGKLVRVSELDMGYVDATGNAVQTVDMTEEQHKEMAELYKFVIQKYLEFVPVNQQWGITQWCATDSPAGSGWRGGEPVGLWDQNYNRKHTYAGFADGLAGK